MSNERPIPPNAWIYLLTDGGVLIGVLIPIIVWIMYIAEVKGGVHFTSSTSDPGPINPRVALYIALGATVCGLGWAAFSVWKWTDLVKRGVVVPGRVDGMSGVINGHVNLSFSYEFAGERFNKRISVTALTAERLSLGQEVSVICSPNSPGRCLLKENSFPHLSLTPSGAEPTAAAKALPPIVEEDHSGWWKTLGIGVLLIVFSAYMYWDLTEFEETGGTKKVDAWIGMLYGVAGKWGVVGFFSIIGLLMTIFGVRELQNHFGKKK